jgi:hypothetical protein
MLSSGQQVQPMPNEKWASKVQPMSNEKWPLQKENGESKMATVHHAHCEKKNGKKKNGDARTVSKQDGMAFHLRIRHTTMTLQ